jgi:hypothetical protein
MIVAAGALLIAGAGISQADISQKVQKTFRGQVLITTDQLPVQMSTDKETIALYKKANAKYLTHSDVDGVATWSFHYTAFFKKKCGTDRLSFDFYTDDKEKLYVANKGLMGVDPSTTVLSGALTINEDEGLNPGRKYIVEVTGEIRGKEVVFATAKLKFK